MIETNPAADKRSQPDVADDYDVIVIGAGPAGSTVSALVAEAGGRVLTLERSGFPRFHVGESLVPETYWTLKRLGLLDALRTSDSPKKYSVQFVNEFGKESAPFYFHDHNDHECSQTWQVVRGEFDRMLLENAVSKGATARTDAHVTEVVFDDDRATGVNVKLGSETKNTARHVAAKVIVDATGQSAFLATRLGLKVPDERLRKAAVWSYFRGGLRDSGRDEGATVILQTEGKKSWFWYIPLSDDQVSVGCTGDVDYMFAQHTDTAEGVFARELARCPGMLRRLQNAERATEYFTTKDFSYRATQTAGPGWLLVGDAFGFIDPVYSSGVFLALRSGEFAADAIVEALANDDFSAEQLGRWQADYARGVELFRKLVYAFYVPGFSFGEFLKKHPEYRGNLVDVLIGDVFKPGVGEMFDVMGDILPPPAGASTS